MDFFLPSDIARLVLGYLKENGFQKTYMCFLKECSHLQEYYKVLMAGREIQTTVLGFSLILILEEWARQKQGNATSSCTQRRDSRIDRRRSIPSPRAAQSPSPRAAQSPSARAAQSPSPRAAQSPLKQSQPTSPLWTPNQARLSERQSEHQDQTNSVEKDRVYPVLKGLLDSLSREQSSVPVLPLTPDKHSGTSVHLRSPLRGSSMQTCSLGACDRNEQQRASNSQDIIETCETNSRGNHSSESTNNMNNAATDYPRLNQVTPSKPIDPSAVPPRLIFHATPVKLFQNSVNTIEATSTSSRSPRRKKPKTPRKRTSDVGTNSMPTLSGAEDKAEPVFQKILQDNRLHEKIAQSCNNFIESITHNISGKEKNNTTAGQDQPEEEDPVTPSRSLEEMLDMDTNFVADLVSDNIDMSDPAYESLFRLFGKEKEAFCEELRQEKKKTEDMAKEVEELEKSIQQEIESASQYSSPIHSIEPTNPQLQGPFADPLATALSSQSDSQCINQQTMSCPDTNPGGFLSSLRNNEFGSPLHSSSGQRTVMSNVISSPSSIVTQPFSPTNYSQIMSPSTPYSQPFTPCPSSHTNDSTLHDPDAVNSSQHSCSMANSVMSPQPNGPIVEEDIHSQIHQSTPIRQKHQPKYLDSSIANCSPLVKADLNANSPVMIQKTDPFTPKSTYTPQSRKCIFTPKGTNRLLFSPPAQIVPCSPNEQTGALAEPHQPVSEFPCLADNEQSSAAAANVSNHEQSLISHSDTNAANSVHNTSPLESEFPLNSGTSPCPTIANSIGCISLPPEKPVSTKKTGRGSKGESKRKSKSKKGIERGSSTFATLKNLLATPSQPQMNPASHLSMPDLLMPPGSPQLAHLSGEDIQNQNIVLLSPGGTSYTIPVLDCQDELGLQTADISGAETVNLWESNLNTSTQLSILPENQVTQPLVDSIEHGNPTDVLNQVRTKKSGKSKSSKAERKKSKGPKKSKKKKKSKDSSYFQSPTSETQNGNNENGEDDEIYIASPLIWGQKTFVRNLDFGVSEGRYRKILPKPSSNTVIVVTNTEPSDTEQVCSPMSAHSPDNSPTANTANDKESASCDKSYNTQVSPESDTEVKSSTVKVCDSESAKVNGVDVTDRSAHAGDSSVLESYKDWKGNMKTKLENRKVSGNRKHISTSTPMHVTETNVECRLAKQAPEVKDSKTPKSRDKSDLKQTRVNKISQKSLAKANVKKSSEKKQNQKTEGESDLCKSSSKSSETTKKDGRKSKSPISKCDESLIDLEKSSDNSAIVGLSLRPSRSRKSPKENVEDCQKSISPAKLKSPKSKAQAKSSPKVSTKLKGKTKKTKGGLLKVKITVNKSKKVEGKGARKLKSRQTIEIETDDSSDDDIPLCQLKQKVGKMVCTGDGTSPVHGSSPTHSTSPVHSILSTPQKGSRSPDVEAISPTKEVVLEKVGLTPTKTVVNQGFKSPGRANPLDVLAEWQGSAQRMRRQSGPVTRNRLNKMRAVPLSPVKTPKKKTPGKTSHNKGSCVKDGKSNEEKPTEKDKLYSSPIAKSTRGSVKRTPVKSLFSSVSGVKDKVEESVHLKVVDEECVGTVGENEEIAQTVNDQEACSQVFEDELKQALQSIEIDNNATAFSDCDNHEEVFERSNGVLQTFQNKIPMEDPTNELLQDSLLNENVYKDSYTDQVLEQPLDSISNGLDTCDDRTEVTASVGCINNIKSSNNNDLNINCHGDNQPSVCDTGIDLSNNEASLKLLSEKARRKEKKRKHKEKKRLRASLEAGITQESSCKDTGIDVGHDSSDKLTTSCESHHRSHHHGHRHHHHCNHHHGKHKKKKSKKRHRDSLDDSKERHKSKRQRLEASRALEMVDIDDALTKLYSSPVAAV